MARHHHGALVGFLICWIRMPLGAEIAPISITQQVSVSGSALACDPLCQEFGIAPPESGQTFSFSNTNQNLPPTNLSVTGQVTDSDSFPGVFVRTASAYADANQSSVAFTPGDIEVELYVDDELTGNITLVEGNADAYSQYLLTFRLNGPTLVQITGSLGGGTNNPYHLPLAGSFYGEIDLSGPGTPFDQVVSSDINSSVGQVFGSSFVLDAGVYTLDAVSELCVEGGYFLESESVFDVSFNADFMAVPEPKRMPPVLGLLMFAGIYLFRKHQQPCLRR